MLTELHSGGLNERSKDHNTSLLYQLLGSVELLLRFGALAAPADAPNASACTIRARHSATRTWRTVAISIASVAVGYGRSKFPLQTMGIRKVR